MLGSLGIVLNIAAMVLHFLPLRFQTYRNLDHRNVPIRRIYWVFKKILSRFSRGLSCSAEILFLMVLKVHLAKVVSAVIAMPTWNSITDYAFAYRLVVIVIFSLLSRRGLFLLPWLCLHISCLRGPDKSLETASTIVPQKLHTLWR